MDLTDTCKKILEINKLPNESLPARKILIYSILFYLYS